MEYVRQIKEATHYSELMDGIEAQIDALAKIRDKFPERKAEANRRIADLEILWDRFYVLQTNLLNEMKFSY